MRSVVVAAVLAAGASLGLACSADETPMSDDLESDLTSFRSSADPLEDRDFADDLDRRFIRAASANLDEAAFSKKWDASLESSVLFMRAYPAAYHADLLQIPTKRILGAEGLCFGDAHPDNFGFLNVGGATVFSFNDLDDAGYCPIAFDAARYFAVLRLYFDDKDLSAEVLEQYVDTVKDPLRAVWLTSSAAPDWAAVRASVLADWTRGDSLALGGELSALEGPEREAVLRVAGADPTLSTYRVLDLAAFARNAGGSGGLRRYWLLVEKGSGAATRRTILELKETATPGAAFGRHSKQLPIASRLTTLKSTFWGGSPNDDYFHVSLLGGRFLVRDRATKKSVKLDPKGGKATIDVLRAQASVMARHQSKYWRSVKKDDLRAWLHASSKTLAHRWRDTYEAAR
ncbi:MAG: DUF2252 family protein [Myxococcales bacterium]|nr:DUF2252 family protein [Myxococcales bacterium]HQY62674.1 DUF2252 family protein [Polyangiaceae bacterium]